MPIELPVTTALNQGASTAYGFWLTYVFLFVFLFSEQHLHL